SDPAAISTRSPRGEDPPAVEVADTTVDRDSHNGDSTEFIAAARISPRTRDGVNGPLRTTTPRPASASSTAFAIAAGGPIAPPSPSPFTPSGFSGDGTFACASRNSGISPAVGSV